MVMHHQGAALIRKALSGRGKGKQIGGGGGGAANGYITPFYPTSLYSTRKRNAAYGGSCMRVRRSSDSTEQDIGFGADGWLDTAALLTFVGAGDGFVRTWYDQSGSAVNLGQATAGNQPVIATAGVVEKIGSNPAVYFTTSGPRYLTVAANAVFGFGTAAYTIEWYVYYTGAISIDKVLTDFRTGSGQNGVYDIKYSVNPSPLYYYNGTTFGGTGAGLDPATASWVSSSWAGGTGLLKGFVGGTQDWSVAATLNFGATRPLTAGADFTGGGTWLGHIGEIAVTKGTQVFTGNHTPRSWA